MKTLITSPSFVWTSLLALLFMGAMHYELDEAGACLFMFMLFTINLKKS
jgi:hypothetical protein